eukprot:UN03725
MVIESILKVDVKLHQKHGFLLNQFFYRKFDSKHIQR